MFFVSLSMMFRRHSAVTAAADAFERGDLRAAHRDLERFFAAQTQGAKPCSHLQTARALRGRLDDAFERVAAPYANKQTLRELEPLGTIAPKRLWVSEDKYAFDVLEMDRYVRTSARFANPYTSKALSANDYDALMRHPYASRLRGWAGKRTRMAAAISLTTRQELAWLSIRLKGNNKLRTIAPESDVALVLADFARYMDTLSVVERRALEQYPMSGGCFSRLWARVSSAQECTALFSLALKSAVCSMPPPAIVPAQDGSPVSYVLNGLDAK